MVNFVEVQELFDEKQHGSRKGHSTLSQLLHQEEIVNVLDNGENIDCVYIDYLKAYDKVDLGLLQ